MDWAAYNAGRNRSRGDAFAATGRKKKAPAACCATCAYAIEHRFGSKEGIGIIECTASRVYIATGLAEQIEVRCDDYAKGVPEQSGKVLKMELTESVPL